MEDKNLAESHPEPALKAAGWDSSDCVLGINGGRLGSSIVMNVRQKANSVKSLYPEIAATADGWDPSQVTASSSQVLPWVCSLGHEWKATPGNRTGRNSGCPYCAGKRAIKGVNDFATLFPVIAKQAYGWDPATVMTHTSSKRDWICSKKHVWAATPSGRVRGRGCPYCAGKKVLPGYNDLITTHPSVAAEAHGWDASTLSAGSDMVRDWKGPCGHVWPDTVSHRVAGRGCSLCSGKRVVVGINDFASAYPEIAKEAHGWDPETSTRGSSKKRQWKGSVCGHIWTASVKFRALGKGCPHCTGKRVLTGFNDLKTTHPELAAEAFGWDPSTVTAGSGHKRAWKGVCGHTWTTRVDFRKRGSGCPPCKAQGYNIGKPGWVYVLVGHVRNHVVVQFGISNVPKKRLAKHRLAGFDAVPLALIHFESGADALAEENRLKALQASHGVLTATKTGVIFDGSTEGFVWHKSANVFVDVLCDELNIDKTVFLKQVAVHTFEASLYDGLIY